MASSSRALAITWVPVLVTWAFLFAVFLGQLQDTPDPHRWPLVPLAYLVASSLLARRLQTLISMGQISTDHADPVLIATGYRSTLLCLLASTLAAVIAVIARHSASLPALIVVLVPLLIQLLLSGLEDYSREQIAIAAPQRSAARDQAQRLRQQWQAELQRLARLETVPPELRSEIERVQAIVPYSSFFRSSSAVELLETIRVRTAAADLLATLRTIR